MKTWEFKNLLAKYFPYFPLNFEVERADKFSAIAHYSDETIGYINITYKSKDLDTDVFSIETEFGHVENFDDIGKVREYLINKLEEKINKYKRLLDILRNGERR